MTQAGLQQDTAPRVRAPLVSQKSMDRVLIVLFFCVTMGAWEGLTRAMNVPSYVLPPPSDIVAALYRGLSSGLYLRHLMFTLQATLAGFFIGSVVGIALGAFIATFRYAEMLVYPYVIMFKSMPKVALAPLFTVWFGLGITSKIISASILVFFPLMVNTIAGLRSADEDRINLMKSMGASRYQIFRYLRLPSALPYIMAGLELAVVLALIGAIVAEFVGARAGLGTLIQIMNANMDGPGQFSVLILLSAIGLLMNLIVRKARKLVLFWDASTTSNDQGPQI